MQSQLWRRSSWLLALALAACGGQPQNPLAGGWSQQTADGTPGMHVEFDGGSNKFLAHTAPRADGGHDHISGTYTFAAGAVTVQAALAGKAGPGTWTGKQEGDALALSAGEQTLKFARGGSSGH
jgi:hypothetical protein